MPGQRSNQSRKIEIEKKEDKRVFVDLSKEYEEDKELLDLLEGKRKKYLTDILLYII